MGQLCKELEEKKKHGVHDESLCHPLCDLFCHLKCCSQFIMALISILSVLLVIIYMPNQTLNVFIKMEKIYLIVFSSTLGLCIATYAIIIGLNSRALSALLEQDKAGNQPFHTICASMIFNGLIQAITIIAILASLITQCSLLFYFVTFLASYILVQIMDILLQLLGLRTFIAGAEMHNKKEKLKKESQIEEFKQLVESILNEISNGRNGQ